MVQSKTLSSMQPPANNSIFNSTVAEVRTSDPTGIPPHMRGERLDAKCTKKINFLMNFKFLRFFSIDLKSLFGQKTNSDVGVNDASPAGSWSKQATDTLKNELGVSFSH